MAHTSRAIDLVSILKLSRIENGRSASRVVTRGQVTLIRSVISFFLPFILSISDQIGEDRIIRAARSSDR
jgi:hypothetical protein